MHFHPLIWDLDVSCIGIWEEAGEIQAVVHPEHGMGTAYVEPVCTDPAYRRQGLARAVVLESIRRAGELGAGVAYVGAIKPLYLAMGFQEIYRTSAWKRSWK